MSDMALYPMRSHKGKKYNIFPLPDGTFEGRVFDRNRRVDYKTHPLPTVEKAIWVCRSVAELVAKGQCVASGLAIHVDEGKDIRVKEEQAYLAIKKEARRKKK